MKLHIILSSLALSAALCSCGDNEPVITERDWSGDFFFASSDASRQDLFYKPAVGFVGDPMPFYDPEAGDFKIMFLQDYRPNQIYTYHPIWAVRTDGGASYESLGEMIPTGNAAEMDAAIGTGSTIYHNGIYHTFYTAHSANKNNTGGIGEAVMLATSSDFRTWTKNRSLLITGKDEYDVSDFRDPFVFKDDNGLFHMLVSTRLAGKGVLAEYTSQNLTDWTSEGVFMTMMWDRFYECPDLFRMGDWWYLVYSEQHDAVRRVQYFKGRSLDELRACTANDAGIWPDDHEGFLDGRGFYAGKTASDGENRYIWGWCASKAGNNTDGARDWAGNLVCHRLIQHTDGTLALGEAKAVAESFGNSTTVSDFSLENGQCRMMNRLSTVNRISLTVKTGDKEDRFGLSFARGSDSERYYTLMVNPEGPDRRKINLEAEGSDGYGFVGDNDSYQFDTPADGVYNITVVTDNSVITLYINDVLCYTNRIYNIAKNPWSVNCYSGSVSVSDIKIFK